MNILILLQYFSCFAMTGLIWLIQLVHYPAFAFVSAEKFSAFHDFHSRRITWIVLPLMTTELVSAALLYWYFAGSLMLFNLCSVGFLWVATGAVSVPLHNRLSKQFNQTTVQRLTNTNWIRTGLWSLRSAALFYVASIHL